MSLTSKHRVDWHEAASCAFQIELKDYSHILEYISEYPLGKNSYRIDLLVIKKLTDEMISKNIARIFRTFNLLEIKGVGSSISIDSYYKTIGYAGVLIAQMGKSKRASNKTQYSSLDVSLTLLSCHYPRKLIKHLREERKIPVAKISDGVYYIKYLHQVSTANTKTKGEQTMMICEGLLNLCGISSAEIIECTKKEDAEYYLPQINQLASQNTYLKSLLAKHNIPFDLAPESAES